MVFVLFVLGLHIGSFLNVLMYRIPRGEGFVTGRSHCPHCHAMIAWYDNLPLVSFLLLRGRCRHCHAAISWQYPIIEVIAGCLVAALWSQPFFLVALLILLVIAVIDLQHFLIFDSVLIVLGAWGLGYHAFMHTFSLGYVVSALACTLFFFALWFFSKGAWLGFGDVKLAGVLGLVFGFPGAIVVIYLAILAGGFFSCILLLWGKAGMKTRLPFGTFLSFGAALFVFFSPYLHEIISRILPY